MYIGEEFSKRMQLFDLTPEKLADESLVSLSVINEIVSNRLVVEKIRQLDLDFLSSALYCDSNYFVSEKIRNKDIVNASLNRGSDTPKSNLIKAKLQSLVQDITHVDSLLAG